MKYKKEITFCTMKAPVRKDVFFSIRAWLSVCSLCGDGDDTGWVFTAFATVVRAVRAEGHIFSALFHAGLESKIQLFLKRAELRDHE